MQKLEAVPGVRSVGLTISLPPDLLQVTDNFMVEGQVLPPNQSAPVGPVVMASDGCSRRSASRSSAAARSTRATRSASAPTVIVNETLARKYLPGVDPIGRRLKIGGPERPIGPKNPWMEIVGVVGDIKYSGLDAPPEPTYYLSVPAEPVERAVRRRPQRRRIRPRSASAAREAVAALDKDIPVARLERWTR